MVVLSNEEETLRAVGLWLAILIPISGLVWRLAWSWTRRIDHLDTCIDEMKEKMDDYQHIRDEWNYMKGTLGIPRNIPVDEVPKEETPE